MNKVDTAVEACKQLIIARAINNNIDKALNTNLPKHKVKKYELVILKSHIRFRNADTKVSTLLSKLSNIESEVLREKLTQIKLSEVI